MAASRYHCGVCPDSPFLRGHTNNGPLASRKSLRQSRPNRGPPCLPVPSLLLPPFSSFRSFSLAAAPPFTRPEFPRPPPLPHPPRRRVTSQAAVGSPSLVPPFSSMPRAALATEPPQPHSSPPRSPPTAMAASPSAEPTPAPPQAPSCTLPRLPAVQAQAQPILPSRL